MLFLIRLDFRESTPNPDPQHQNDEEQEEDQADDKEEVGSQNGGYPGKKQRRSKSVHCLKIGRNPALEKEL